MKNITLLLFLLLVETHCQPSRPIMCDYLRDEIELSYKNNAPHSLKMRMLMEYDELDCDTLAPLNKR